MRRLTFLILLLLALAGAAVSVVPAGAATSPSWVDRSTVDIRLPSGWRLAACEGDAPFLCASDPSGVVDGTVVLSVTDLGPSSDTSAEALAAVVAGFHETIEEDRLISCPDHRFGRDGLQPATVGGVAGHRFGFTLRDRQGRIAEQAVIHHAFAVGREFAVNTSFVDPDGCPGRDPDRVEFTVSDMDQVMPYLDQVVAQVTLPSDFAAGPACPPGKVPGPRFSDIAGNPHAGLIDCAASLRIVRGTVDGRFLPAETVTRAHAAALVARMLETMGQELPAAPVRRFRDTAGNPHAHAIDQLAALGVVNGTSGTTFSPGRAVTRAEAATLVVRAYEATSANGLYDDGAGFDDVDGIHAPTVSRAATAGLVHGRDADRYDPDGPVRRDEMAAIVGRAANRISWTRGVLSPAGGAGSGAGAATAGRA